MSFRFVVALAALSVSFACQSIPGTQNVVLRDGQVLGQGRMQVQTLTLERFATVRIEEDLEIVADGRVLILGRLVAADRFGMAMRRDAPRITITSRDMIEIDGEVLGGRGYSFEGGPQLITSGVGGAGSCITLRAPEIRLNGVVRAGNGGRGDLGFDGGAGGDVTVQGKCSLYLANRSQPATAVNGSGGGVAIEAGAAQRELREGTYRGGDGGAAGPAAAGQSPGPSGGRGGNATASEYASG